MSDKGWNHFYVYIHVSANVTLDYFHFNTVKINYSKVKFNFHNSKKTMDISVHDQRDIGISTVCSYLLERNMVHSNHHNVYGISTRVCSLCDHNWNTPIRSYMLPSSNQQTHTKTPMSLLLYNTIYLLTTYWHISRHISWASLLSPCTAAIAWQIPFMLCPQFCLTFSIWLFIRSVTMANFSQAVRNFIFDL